MITISKEAQDQALAYAESIINTVRDPLIALDQDLKVVTASKAFYDVFKVNTQETIGQHIYDLGNKQWDIPKLRHLLETILPEKTTFDNYEIEHVFSTIGKRTMLLNARQIDEVLGKKRIILLAIEDITARKLMEGKSRKNSLQELKRSQNMLIHSEKLASLGRLVSEIVHEVNNPLTIISGNAELSLMEEAVSVQEKKSLKIIVKQCERAKDVIRRVLRFARPSKGEVKEVDIAQSIEAVAEILEKQFMLSSNVKIKRHYQEKAIRIPIDEQQMQEVYMNLLNNAKEAMPNGGVITITTSVEGKLLRIDFKDTGEGMSEEVMGKIMEPFFTTKETGTGIGLAVCCGIVKAHGGELRFESQLGKGTTATVWLSMFLTEVKKKLGMKT